MSFTSASTGDLGGPVVELNFSSPPPPTPPTAVGAPAWDDEFERLLQAIDVMTVAQLRELTLKLAAKLKGML